MVESGTEITWSSQAGGRAKTKVGTIVAFLAPNDSAEAKAGEFMQTFPNPKSKPAAIEGNNTSLVARYLVVMPDGPTKKTIRFYTPLASIVDRAHAATLSSQEAPVP